MALFRKRRGRRSRRPMRRRIRRRPMTARRVRRLIGAELKHGTIGFNGDAPAQNPENVSLSLINPGTGASERIGNWVQIVNIHGNLRVQGTANGTVPIVTCRAFIFRWNENNTLNVPTLAQIVNSDIAPQGPYNFQNRKVFTIVWSRVFTIVNNETNPQITKKLPFYIRLRRGPKTVFNDVLPTKFHYFFQMFSDTDTANSVPSYRLDITTRWTDS